MKNNPLPFSKKNYRLMLVGIAIIVVGFAIMAMDQTTHGFGFMGLTLGPIVVLSGFLFEFYAIFYKQNK
jgi:membrane-bound ClpP family serine protease